MLTTVMEKLAAVQHAQAQQFRAVVDAVSRSGAAEAEKAEALAARVAQLEGRVRPQTGSSVGSAAQLPIRVAQVSERRTAAPASAPGAAD